MVWCKCMYVPYVRSGHGRVYVCVYEGQDMVGCMCVCMRWMDRVGTL